VPFLHIEIGARATGLTFARALAERWLSGLRQRVGDALYGQLYRRFESFPSPPRGLKAGPVIKGGGRLTLGHYLSQSQPFFRETQPERLIIGLRRHAS
jgi:hypothetical protein